MKKCPYCDFNSHENGDKSRYIESLLADLDADVDYIQGREIASIFIGGGTPSLMSVAELEQLFTGLSNRLNIGKNIEITLEANPGTFEVEKFQAFKKIGINRLSIGVQSFVNENLQSLGRIHNANEATHACKQALKIFDNVNIDLMYGLENQSIDACLQDIKRAVILNPSHISFYQLTIEPNTLFAKYPPKLPQDETLWQMGVQGVNLLEQQGFKRYEISAFGKISCKHNLNYWQFGDYLGIGAGAHGKITLLDKEEPCQIIRTTKHKSPKEYLQNSAKKTRLVENLGFDFMLNALRLKQGFDVDLFYQTTGQSIDRIYPKILKARHLGLVDVDETRITPTKKGYDFLNDLQALFL